MSRIQQYRRVNIWWLTWDNRLPVGDEFLVIYKEENGLPDYVAFRCPCGKEDCYVTLPVVSPERPRPNSGRAVWDFMTGGHLIHPSVHHTTGCKSHYFINADGTVQWC